MAGPLNYTTTIAASKTAGECIQILANAGASAVAVTYEDKIPCGLSFSLVTPHGQRGFTLPVNVDGVQALLTKAHRQGRVRSISRATAQSREHATRVAWRVVKDWLEAQLALIDAQMASLDQVMLPYLHVDGELTLYQAYRDREEVLAIEAAAS